ncbi:MAG: hypothetical protein ACRDHF_02555 [Tepidiformaceae bacterium]
MRFPFRRPAAAAWASRLPQLERAHDPPDPPSRPALPGPGSLTLTLTHPPAPAITARDVVADPMGAEGLPPAALVAAVLACDTENRSLRRRLHARRQELHELKTGMAEHVVEDAEIRGRLRTLEEVISALHANIEDLRLQRDQLLALR